MSVGDLFDFYCNTKTGEFSGMTILWAIHVVRGIIEV